MKHYEKHKTSMNVHKYSALAPVDLSSRSWPSKIITEAPYWCSVDLRDGNQALIEPMDVAQKIKAFKLFVDIGLKEIEVGFPAASTIDFEFVRYIITHGLIPDDVTIQVCSQARDEQIIKSIEAIQGAKKATYHVYNPTSVAQRRCVFENTKEETIKMAVDSVEKIKSTAKELLEKTELGLQYSPESFTATELDFAVDICNAVVDCWDPKDGDKVIINLPATVELFTPNIFADCIEYMNTSLARREDIILSIHTHNDRGTTVAASELGLLAGADRVEGTILGNGERTGNVDLITMALNLFTSGIDPGIDVTDINAIADVIVEVTNMPIHPRHPYAGSLVFTAFSGSHQDAIRKGLLERSSREHQYWDVPYLPVDPADIGRDYKQVIRVNSQSGKGAVQYLLETEYGIVIPKLLATGLQQYIQISAEEHGGEVDANYIYNTLIREYSTPDDVLIESIDIDSVKGAMIKLTFGGSRFTINKDGAVSPVETMVKALSDESRTLDIQHYSENSLGNTKDADALAVVSVTDGNRSEFGIGISENAIYAPVMAILAAYMRLVGRRVADANLAKLQTLKLAVNQARK